MLLNMQKNANTAKLQFHYTMGASYNVFDFITIKWTPFTTIVMQRHHLENPHFIYQETKIASEMPVPHSLGKQFLTP